MLTGPAHEVAAGTPSTRQAGQRPRPAPCRLGQRGGRGGCQPAAAVSLALLATIVSMAASQTAKTGRIAGKVDNPWVKQSPAVVYLKGVPGRFKPPKKHPVLDQRGLRFIPHVLPVLVGSTVDFPNNDEVRHNVYAPSHSVKQFNLGVYPPGVSKQVRFDRVGVVPLLCNVHSEMSAFIVVLPNPYFATTDQEGNFVIDKVPPGKYTISFWHERLEPKSGKVPVAAGKTVRVTFRRLKAGWYKTRL